MDGGRAKTKLSLTLISTGIMSLTFASANLAWADPVGVGVDEFHTLEGTFATLPLSAGGGRLDLRSRPLEPTRGDTDTIVRRLDPLNLNVGQQGDTRIQLTALSMESVSPVNIGGSFFDVFVGLNGTQPIGSMTVFHGTQDGGTFNATLPVDALLTFTQVGNPSNTFNQPFPHIEFASSGNWSHTRPIDYPDVGGGFNLTRTPINPPIEPTGTATLIECANPPTCLNATVVHIVRPETVVPEPSTLLLLGSGLAGVAAFTGKKLLGFHT
jgi:hypothetical protein